MTPEEKKLIELLKFHTNDKAKEALLLKDSSVGKQSDRFYHGQYCAFNEIYSMLINIERTL